MAQRATSLGPKPSLFFFLIWSFVFFSFLCLLLIEEHCSPPKRAFLFIFQCPPLFLLSLFCLSPFRFLFLFLSCSFLCSFLLFFIFCFLLFPCFCLFLSLPCFFAFVSWKGHHQTIKLESFLPSIFSLLFSVLFSHSQPLFLSLFYVPHFKLCFLFNINVLSFKKDK